MSSDVKLRKRQRLGKYRIEGRLAEGGFAVVYKATDLIEDQPVAMKVPRAEHNAEMATLKKEVRVNAGLEHPNILPLKDASILNGHLVLVTPLGKSTLHDRLQRRMAFSTALNYAEQMISAVAYAHRKKVLHCDIKPENFILFDDDRLRLGDFGIARVALGTRTIQGSGTGTLGYLAPEQALGRPSYRSDVFSLCLVLWRLFSGELPKWPFKWPLPGLDRLKERAGPELAALLKRGLEVDEKKRFANASELEEAFARVSRRLKRKHKQLLAGAPPGEGPERTRAATVLVDARLSHSRLVKIGAGEAALFSTVKPHAKKSRPNMDVVATLPAGGDRAVLVVADGCGGHPAGDRASALTLQELQRAVGDAARQRRSLRDGVIDGIDRANEAVLELRRGAGTTLAAVMVAGSTLRAVHVGDAGVLVCGQRGRIRYRTLPHGPVGDALRAGILREEDAPFHEESHVVSNLVGSHDMWMEIGPTLELGRHDTVVVGSDGLFDNVGADEIADLVRSGSLRESADELARLCLHRMDEPAPARPASPDDLGFLLFRLMS